MNNTARKSKDLERLQDETAYLVWVSKILKSSQIPMTEDYELKLEPETVMKAREFAQNMTSEVDQIMDKFYNSTKAIENEIDLSNQILFL